MSDLNIRNVPEELIRALKVEAAESNTTLRDVCIDRLSFVLHRGSRVASANLGSSATERKNEAAVKLSSVQAKPMVPASDFLKGLGGSVPEQKESEVGETVYERDEYCD